MPPPPPPPPPDTTNQSFVIKNDNNFGVHIKDPSGQSSEVPKDSISKPFGTPGDYQINDSTTFPVKTYFTVHVDSDDRTLTISPGTLTGKFRVESTLD